jgi:hypothetical protein
MRPNPLNLDVAGSGLKETQLEEQRTEMTKDEVCKCLASGLRSSID